MPKKQTLLLGAHISISGGVNLAIDRAKAIGCTAIQIFTKSNRQWGAKPLNKKDVALFKEKWEKSSIHSIIAHATYLINIGSPNKLIEKKSIAALTMELNRCAELGISYLVLHAGSYSTSDENSCLQRISDNLNKVLAAAPTTNILLETMAGQGTGVCYSFEHIKTIIKNSEFKKRLGVCFDTCHAFAAGYDFRTKKPYADMWESFDTIIGLDKLKAMHINDSKQDIGSRVDRHTDIGKGKLGLEAFKLIFNDPRFFGIPKVLETPKNSPEEDLINMQVIYDLLTKKTKSTLNYEK